jgi:hypothetical protein
MQRILGTWTIAPSILEGAARVVHICLLRMVYVRLKLLARARFHGVRAPADFDAVQQGQVLDRPVTAAELASYLSRMRSAEAVNRDLPFSGLAANLLSLQRRTSV